MVRFLGQHVTCPIAPYNRTDWVQCDLCKVWVHTSCNNLKSVPKQYVCPGCVHHGFSTRDIPRGEDTYLKNMDTQRQLIKGLLEGSYGKGAAGDFRVYMAESGDSTPTLWRTIGERFFGTLYASCIIYLTALLLFCKISFAMVTLPLGGLLFSVGHKHPPHACLSSWVRFCMHVGRSLSSKSFMQVVLFPLPLPTLMFCNSKMHCVHGPWIPTLLCNLRAREWQSYKLTLCCRSC